MSPAYAGDIFASRPMNVYRAEPGLVHHQIIRKFASAFGLVRYVDGLLAFAHDVDPRWATL